MTSHRWPCRSQASHRSRFARSTLGQKNAEGLEILQLFIQTTWKKTTTTTNGARTALIQSPLLHGLLYFPLVLSRQLIPLRIKSICKYMLFYSRNIRETGQSVQGHLLRQVEIMIASVFLQSKLFMNSSFLVGIIKLNGYHCPTKVWINRTVHPRYNETV